MPAAGVEDLTGRYEPGKRVIFIDDSHFSDFSFGLGPVNVSWVVLSNFLYRRSKTYLLVTRAYLLAGNPNRYWPCQFEGDTGPDFKQIGSFHRAHAPSNKEGALSCETTTHSIAPNW